MKALMKGDTVHLFKKYQRPKQDIQMIMNQIQDKQIAKSIGISEFQLQLFTDFFQQTHKIKLPKNYIRYPNQEKTKVIYRNQIDQVESIQHPSLNLIKTLFYHIISNNKAVYSFNTKQKKLLPFVQEKMMRQSIGINSKRKDAQKSNLQRDQNGKMVLSKLARIPPDVSKLISSRSYLLKMLVQKIFTRKQIWGRGKRANAYANILSSYHAQMKNSEPDKQDDENQNQASLQMYENIFIKAANFYKQQYGNVDIIPRQVTSTELFRKGTPDNVVRNMKILNIDKNSMELFWLARMMDCLPLPPLWSLKLGTSYNEYIYQPNNLLFQIHPSYIYIIEQMNRFRSNFDKMQPMQKNYYSNMRQMMFYDYFQRPYVIDIFGIMNKQENLKKYQGSSKKMKRFLRHGGVGTLVNCDWVIIQGIRNSQMKDLAYVLVGKIEQFWKSKNFGQQTYSPSISPYGQVLWSSNVTGKCISYCPYKTELTTIIKKQTQKLPQLTQNDIKLQYKNLPEEYYNIFVHDIQQQRINFLKYFIVHDPLPLPYPYEIRPQFENDYYENHFSSIFNLQQDLPIFSGKKPFWLQKVHAAEMTRMYCNILDYNEKSFQDILKIFVKYSMQSTKIHEPTRLQQIEMRIAKLTNGRSLRQFIKDFNDLEARQQRKRQLLLQQQNGQDDIFGSSISNIDIQQRRQQQNDKQNLQDSDQDVSQSSQQIQQLVIKIQSSDSQNQNLKNNTQQDKIIIQQQHQEDKQDKISYKGKIYYQDQKIDKFSQNQLDSQIRKMTKLALKKNKYSHVQIKHQNQNWKDNLNKGLLNSINKQEKKNIIVTKFDSLHSPYKHFRFQQNINLKKNNSSPYKYSRIIGTPTHLNQDKQDITPFESQINYSFCNDSILEQIQNWKKLHPKTNQVQQQSQTSFQNPQRKKENDETHHTIILQPLKRMKPSIDQDPRLKHIKNMNLNMLPNFGRTFSQFNKRKQEEIQINKKKKLKNSGSLGTLSQLKNLSSTQSQFKTTLFNNEKMKGISVEKSIKSSKQIELLNKKLQKVNIAQTARVLRKPQRSDFGFPFNRVCLEKTANHFLSSQAVLKRGDLITLEARKTLLLKNRGLGTYVSKKY